MDRLLFIGFFAIVIFSGLLSIWKRLKIINDNIEFENEYLSNFKNYVDSCDMNSYTWLIHRSNKMQNMMGSYGIVDSFKPPYQNFLYRNYPIILNIIPQIQQIYSTGFLQKNIHEYAMIIYEAILRHIGAMEDTKENLNKNIKNPLAIIHKGMQSILNFPLLILFYFGLLNRHIYEAISANMIFKIFSNIFGFIGFLSAIVGLITGWEQFIKILNKLLTQI